jgi:hypothetical protein
VERVLAVPSHTLDGKVIEPKVRRLSYGGSPVGGIIMLDLSGRQTLKGKAKIL